MGPTPSPHAQSKGTRTPGKAPTPGPSVSRSPSAGRSNMPSEDILSDLCMRFVLNQPAEELASFERILFAVEQAHWFYEDVTREAHPHLRPLPLKDFMHFMFASCATLRPHLPQLDIIFNDWHAYKGQVPTAGAIMLNESCDKVLLVKGWKANASWGFPKGKKNKDEDDDKAAVREVFEETDFDLTALINPRSYLEVYISKQRCRLFLVPGVPESAPFQPRTAKEISAIGWHNIEDLQMRAGAGLEGGGGGEFGAAHSRVGSSKFFMVAPFIGPLQNWLSANGLPFPNNQPAGIPGSIHVVWSTIRDLKASPASSHDLLPPLFPSPPQPTPRPLQSLLEILLMPTPPAPAQKHTQPPWPELRVLGGDGPLHQDPLPILTPMGFLAGRGTSSPSLTFGFDLEAIMQSFDG